MIYYGSRDMLGQPRWRVFKRGIGYAHDKFDPSPAEDIVRGACVCAGKDGGCDIDEGAG